jgi:FkbM family methyltransferase
MLNILRRYIQKTGFDLRRHNILNNSHYQQMMLLDKLKINQIIDIGANQGQYALELISSGFKGGILSMEPLSVEYEKLKAKASKHNNWLVKRCALGNFDGEIPINISLNSVSSSIFPIMDAHLKAEAESRYISQESAPIFKLDSIFEEYIFIKDKIFLKIDTQGYEFEVLQGASKSLPKIMGLKIELSLRELYQGQKNWIDVINFLEKNHFELWGIHPIFADNLDFRILQVDALFIRNYKFK